MNEWMDGWIIVRDRDDTVRVYDIMKGDESGRCGFPLATRMLDCVDTQEFKLAIGVHNC